MNKWIAEFELEDGDIMPEHMDLEYKGARIDFHCRPLEQEPFDNRPCISSGVCEHDKQKVLDKIRAEIEQLTITKGGDDYVRKMAELFSLKMKVLQILDKYKAESESQESEEQTDD